MPAAAGGAGAGTHPAPLGRWVPGGRGAPALRGEPRASALSPAAPGPPEVPSLQHSEENEILFIVLEPETSFLS